MAAWTGRVAELSRKAADAKKHQVVADQLQAAIERIRSDVATTLEHIDVNFQKSELFGYR
ncbi:hypothetical protein M1N42_02860 [Thermodesulfovibrionales bacterium]|nr:hypothetical protein [Thermodesulfovibrionales bacterium]